MKVVINQSNYIPWKGYFDLIHDADLFLFHDDVQYTKSDWRNRNRIKTPNGPEWLTIPVGRDEHRLVCDVPLPQGAWIETHLRAMAAAYGRQPFFADYESRLRGLLEDHKTGSLSQLNQAVTIWIARDVLGVKTQFGDSRQFGLTSRKQERVLDLLRAVGATTYISGPAAKSYLSPERFAREHIDLIWKDYAGYPEYAQPHPPFEHLVSVVDLLFCVGPGAPYYVWGWRDEDSQPDGPDRQ